MSLRPASRLGNKAAFGDRRLLRQLRGAAVSGRRSALRGRFFSVAGQVRDLTWSPSLLARSWHLNRRPSNGRATQSPQRASATPPSAARRRGPGLARSRRKPFGADRSGHAAKRPQASDIERNPKRLRERSTRPKAGGRFAGLRRRFPERMGRSGQPRR